MQPKASRPSMPGYGVQGPEEGTGPRCTLTTDNALRVEPSVVLALDSADFTGSPTKWQF